MKSFIPFFTIPKGGILIKFNSLEEAKECYGTENLVPIDFIKQLLFYAKCGCQPKFIWEKEGCPGKVTGWFLKSETVYAKKKWDQTKPDRPHIERGD